VVLVSPKGIRFSTKTAYLDLRRPLLKRHQSLLVGAPSWLQALEEIDFPAFENDFETAAFERYPRLRQLKRQLCESGALTGGMTGSGSGFFGVYRTTAEAQRALKAIVHRGDWAVQTRVGSS
jgi:4-diphosphocytidyl-2C-methyl-D-erythritol kinase